MDWIIRLAKKEDLEKIKGLIFQESQQSTVLPRTSINYRNYIVVESNGALIGCVGYKVWGKILPELISTVIVSNYRNKGVGKQMVSALIELIKLKRFRNLMLLTSVPKFFQKLGFTEIDVGLFPSKVLKDCAKCPKNLGSPYNPVCPDVAMSLNLKA